jgi:hypothetical protein
MQVNLVWQADHPELFRVVDEIDPSGVDAFADNLDK